MVIKTLDPDRYSAKMPHSVPDPYQMNTDPKPCKYGYLNKPALVQHEVLHHPVGDVDLALVSHELQHAAVRRPVLLLVR